jgi:hypothetical protein
MRGTLCWPPSWPRARIQASNPPGRATATAGRGSVWPLDGLRNQW